MNNPSIVSPLVAAMQARAKIIQDLDGGTAAMRAAGKTYLPLWRQEEESDWKNRLAATVLFPAVTKALNTMTGKPFEEPITVGDDVPAGLVPHLENIDNAGRNLDVFARDVCRAAMRDGITWVLVDYPLVKKPFANLAAERASGVRPYWVHVPLSRMLGYRTANVAGRMVVVQARFLESVEVPDGQFGTATVAQVRVLEPGMVWVYRKDAKSDWVLIADESGPTTLQEIPLVPIQMDRTGFWEAKPFLEDLAHLNILHWQSSSEQRHALHYARVLPLAADEGPVAGVPGEEVPIKSGGIIVGFKGLKFLEVSGDGNLKAGREDLMDIEDQMRRVAGEMLERSGGTKTATENKLEASEANAGLKSRIGHLKDALEECLRLHAAWMKEPDGGSLVINTEWDEEGLTAQMMQAMTQARQAGAISQEAYSYQMAKSGMLPPDRTPEQEMESLNSEGPTNFPTV